jgi:hypothetical protein
MTAYDKFISQLNAVQEIFPNLKQVELHGKIILRGTIAIVDKEGKHWEDYEIEIHCTDNFPKEFPRLFEVSGKIPRIADWHVYEDTGSCCTKIPPEEVLRCQKGITVSEYITEEVIPYFFNQTHRRVEGYYINGEYSHGGKGLFEYYSKELKTGNDYKLTLDLLRFIATQEKPKRTSFCFCGKKEKFRHCHKGAFEKLKSLGHGILKHHYGVIAKATGCFN